METDKTYTVFVYEAEPDETGYWAEVADLPGCVAQGESLDEVTTNVTDAILAWEETKRALDLGTDRRPKFTIEIPIQQHSAEASDHSAVPA